MSVDSYVIAQAMANRIHFDQQPITQAATDAFWSMSGRFDMTMQCIMEGFSVPHVTMRPKLSIDGNMWCALYGDNLQDGVAGFGESPALACADFDGKWHEQLKEHSKAYKGPSND